MVNDILDVSKIEAGKLDLNVMPRSGCGNASPKLTKPLALRADQKGLELTLDIAFRPCPTKFPPTPPGFRKFSKT